MGQQFAQQSPISGPHRRRAAVLSALIALAVLALAAALLLRAWQERGGTNSYAELAGAFLKLQPDVERCVDVDCIRKDGRIYVAFPPLPAVVAMPMVAAFGTDAAGFGALTIGALFLSLWLWLRIFRKLEVPNDVVWPLLAAIGFASPLYFVSLRAEGVWFFAHVVAFPLATLAVHEALCGRLWTSGAALAGAMLCRQFSMLLAPLLYVLALGSRPGLFRIDRERLAMAARLGLPLAAAALAYLSYNAWRFGNPFDTGYGDIVYPPGMLKHRAETLGLWNVAYAPFNAVYLLLQGFHAEFAAPERTKLVGLDNAGTGILAASPWLLLALLAPCRRDVVVAALLIVGLSGVMLFYHSNGYTQFNTQRYVLDWLPAALVILAHAARHLAQPLILQILVLWALSLNLAMLAIVAATRAA